MLALTSQADGARRQPTGNNMHTSTGRITDKEIGGDLSTDTNRRPACPRSAITAGHSDQSDG